jgi:hypothetical protein
VNSIEQVQTQLPPKLGQSAVLKQRLRADGRLEGFPRSTDGEN